MKDFEANKIVILHIEVNLPKHCYYDTVKNKLLNFYSISDIQNS